MNTQSRLQIETFTDPMFQENGYLLWTRDGTDCWAIDPGFPPQAEEMTATLRENNLVLQAILLTHGHPDHIAGVSELRTTYPDAKIIAPRAEARLLTDPEANMSLQLGFPVVAPPADRLLEPGDTLALGALTWQALDVSGHSPGGLAYHCAEAGVVFGGDALFMDSIGRYDFPGSSREKLLNNIQKNLFGLPDETVLYSGHGPPTTIGRERRQNLTLRMELGRLG